MPQIIIISSTKILERTLIFNYKPQSEVEEVEITTVKDIPSLSAIQQNEGAILITDDAVYSEIAELFTPQISLVEVTDYIEKQRKKINKHQIDLDLMSRTVSIGRVQIELTEREALIINLLLSTDNLCSDTGAFIRNLKVNNLSAEALRASIYRINQKFIRYDFPLSLRFKGSNILLEKL